MCFEWTLLKVVASKAGIRLGVRLILKGKADKPQIPIRSNPISGSRGRVEKEGSRTTLLFVTVS